MLIVYSLIYTVSAHMSALQVAMICYRIYILVYRQKENKEGQLRDIKKNPGAR